MIKAVEDAIQRSLRSGDRRRGRVAPLQPAEEEQHAAWLGELHATADGLNPSDGSGTHRFWGLDVEQQKLWKVVLLPPKVDAIQSAPLAADFDGRLRQRRAELMAALDELTALPSIDNQTAFVLAADNVRQAASDLNDAIA